MLQQKLTDYLEKKIRENAQKLTEGGGKYIFPDLHFCPTSGKYVCTVLEYHMSSANMILRIILSYFKIN